MNQELADALFTEVTYFSRVHLACMRPPMRELDGWTDPVRCDQTIVSGTAVDLQDATEELQYSFSMLPAPSGGSLGGKRMAIRVAELARAGLTPDWMPGVVPRYVPVEIRQNQPVERATTIVVGTERVLSRDKWRTVEVLACPVTWRPHPEQIESTRRGYPPPQLDDPRLCDRHGGHGRDNGVLPHLCPHGRASDGPRRRYRVSGVMDGLRSLCRRHSAQDLRIIGLGWRN